MEPIVIEHLSKKYREYVAVNDLSLTVERGVCVGYLGPNGAGKTTTIKVLTNLLRASSGKAYLNGIDVIHHPIAALDGVGAVVETPEFYPQLTPDECLSYVGTIRGMSGEAIAERSHAVLDQVKLLEVADKRTGQFSKGMKQRLAIAQALLHEPSILILDEPTSGLDPRGMVEVREIIKGLIKTNITILMSSHLLYEVQEVCDKVAIIDRGSLLTYDSVTNLSAGHDVTVTITGYEQDRFITWEVSGPNFPSIGHYYGYRLEPVEGGTLVTSIYDWSKVGERWRSTGAWPIIPESALKATLGILARTVIAAP